MGLSVHAARLGAVTLATIVFALVPASVAAAATTAPSAIRVNTTGDNLVVDLKCSLREAIRSANLDRAIGGCTAGNGSDTILLPAGRYILGIPGQNENGGLTGDLDTWTPMTIRGVAPATTIIDGNRLDRVIQVITGRVTIDLVKITGGTTKPHEGRVPANAGGGIENFGNLTLTNSVVTGNTTGEYGQGGGIFSSGMLTVRDSWITDNRADAGGGIYASGSAYVVRSHLEYNRAIGMASHPPVGPESENPDTVSAAGDAGGITSEGYLSVTGSVVAHNSGDNEWGHGGIAMEGGVIRDTTVDSNYGSICGTGGISMVASQLISSTVSRNSNGNCGPAAGGVYAIDSEIINSTISSNNASGAVAGIRSERSSIVSSTISGNTTGVMWGAPVRYEGPGGLDAAGTTTIRNTIIAGNLGSLGYPDYLPASDCVGTVVSGGHNLIGKLAGCTFTKQPSDFVNVDAKLGPLANNGGPTWTHTLRPGSPAIDAWYDGSVGAGASCPAFDQRGVHRPQDGNGDGLKKCDIGAVERQ